MGFLENAAGTHVDKGHGKEGGFSAALEAPVIVADDDPYVRTELEDLLRDNARSAASVGDAATLVATLKTVSEPAIVLLDLHMPDSDVCDTLNSLMRLSEPVALILFSGKHGPLLEHVAHLAEAKHLTVIGTLAKPLSQDALWPMLRQGEAALGRRGEAPPPQDLIWQKPLTRSELRGAIQRHEFEAVYQPLISLHDGRCRTVEALARWRHPAFGILRPHHFLAAIKRTGLLREFSEAVTHRVIADLLSWEHQGVNVDGAINLPPTLLEDGDFAAFLLDAVAAAGIAPDRLVLELLEDELLFDPEKVLDALIRLRVAGFRISIDDFGAEYSSLNRLLWLPISELKIDRSLIAALGGTQNALIIIRNTVELAHQMGLTVVAEGLETEGALHELTALGCDTAQGFLLSPPVFATEVAACIEQPAATVETAALSGSGREV